MWGQVVLACSSGTARDGLDVLPRDGLFELVALVVVGRLHQTPRPCSPEGVRLVCDAFEAVDESWLTAQFEKGRTHLVTVMNGKPILSGPAHDWPDVKAIFDEVMKATK